MTRRMRALILVCVSFAWLGCGDDSNDGPSTECIDACSRIEDACNSTTEDCAEDCQDDFNACPSEMQALLDCIDSSVLECDPDQDQGLAEAPCEAEHEALGVCGPDAF